MGSETKTVFGVIQEVWIVIFIILAAFTIISLVFSLFIGLHRQAFAPDVIVNVAVIDSNTNLTEFQQRCSGTITTDFANMLKIGCNTSDLIVPITEGPCTEIARDDESGTYIAFRPTYGYRSIL